MRMRQNHVCRENYVKARSYSFQTEAAVAHKYSNTQFRENWYALYISIIKSVSINSALDFMDMKPQYKERSRVSHQHPKAPSPSDLEGESYYFLNIVCGIRQCDLSLLMDVPAAIISNRVCRCRKNYKKSKEEQQNERNERISHPCRSY